MFNTYLIAATGYAILYYPPIPVEAPATGGPMCDQMADAILPAIDAATATGRVRSDRVGIMGLSWGGYATANLMTCTDRFTAGLAIAGFYDLLSYSLSFKHRDRFNGHALGVLSGFSEVEQISPVHPFQFGATPWENIDVYIENSPLFRMDELSAPLMLFHGDLDAVPMNQAEHMFTAGRRLGKDVTFVRYWGEYHQLWSPAKIREFWDRTTTFFDEHLR